MKRPFLSPRFFSSALLAIMSSLPSVPVFATSSAIVGTYFGNQNMVDAPAIPVTLDGAKQISCSFFMQNTDTMLGASFHGRTVGACPNYTVIFADDDGSGVPVTTTSLGGDSGGMNSNGWTDIGFTGGFDLPGGSSYHVILTSQGSADASNYFVVDQYTQPPTQLIPFNQLFDGSLYTTYDDGSGFVETDQQPIFVIEGASANYGNTYLTANNPSVAGLTIVSEVFQAPAGNIWVGKVGTFLQRVNSPIGPLLYQLEDLSSPSTLSSGTLATNATAATSFGWIDVNLAGGPFQLNPSHNYRVSFSSPGSSGTAVYKVDNPTNPDPGTEYDDATFDGQSSYTAVSSDGGVGYTNNLSSDLTFRFLVVSAPTNTPTISKTPTDSPTPTVTNTPTPTLTATLCPSLFTGTLSAGTYDYCGVNIPPGNQVVITGAVIWRVTGDCTINGSVSFAASNSSLAITVTGGNFSLGVGAAIIGDGSGSTGGPPGTFGNGPSAFIGGFGSNTSAYGGSGGGHGGAGGNGGGPAGGTAGGVSYDNASSPPGPQLVGSGGGGGYGPSVLGGNGGGALAVTVLGGGGQAVIDGIISMNGTLGSNAVTSGAGGGAGGSVNISADNLSAGGTIIANGGKGGDATLNAGGGGSGGGMINLCSTSSYSAAGILRTDGGSHGTAPSPGFDGQQGQVLHCTIVVLPPTVTRTATATPSATPTKSPTLTPTDTPTNTPTLTPTQTPTFSPTDSPTITLTPTISDTATLSPTLTPTFTNAPTNTKTTTPSSTPTKTFTVTMTPTLTPTGSVTSTSTPDTALYLDQNVFDPTAQPMGMDVRVDQPGQVKISIYNIAGEQVVKLLEQEETAGNYRVFWDGKNKIGSIVGNGVYFVLVHQPSGTTTRKVIVLK